MTYPVHRMRRFRQNENLRALIQETVVVPEDFIWPIFIRPDIQEPVEISTMPGVWQYPLDIAIQEIHKAQDVGIRHIMCRPYPGKTMLSQKEIIEIQSKIIGTLTEACPDVTCIVDGFFFLLNKDGSWGIKDDNGILDNALTIASLQQQAVAQAQAGAHMVTVLGRHDGGVQALRSALDDAQLPMVPIMSYAANFSTPQAYAVLKEQSEHKEKERKHSTETKIAPGNLREALRQTALDVEEGADFLVVKPISCYLDVLQQVKQTFGLPTAAYTVSGEYSMVKAGAMMGWLDEKKVVHEMFTCAKRAGADRIISYWSRDFLAWS